MGRPWPKGQEDKPQCLERPSSGPSLHSGSVARWAGEARRQRGWRGWGKGGKPGIKKKWQVAGAGRWQVVAGGAEFYPVKQNSPNLEIRRKGMS